MISKDYAKHIIQTYYHNYSLLFDNRHIFDKLFVKEGNKALLYPMLAIKNKNEDEYNNLCHKIHYDERYI
jgi:DNA-binding cell septation regulator SpoVG